MNKQAIKNLINREIPTIFEIGCADGQDTLDFIQTFQGALKIYAFEPEPKNIALVKSRITTANHFLFEGVIADVTGPVTFHRSRTDNEQDLSYSGSIKAPKEHLNEWPFIKFDTDIEVQAITLDQFVLDHQIDTIDFIWADVQGAEASMIKGGQETFRNKVRFLYTEYSNKEYYEGQANLATLLNDLGPNWTILQDFGTDVLLKNNTLA